jgi:hypothetical protein
MINEMITVRNLETGEVGRIRRRLFENPKINDGILVEADEDDKPYAPELYKSKMPVVGDDVNNHISDPVSVPDTEEDEK